VSSRAIILASTSPARIALLRAAGVVHQAVSPGVDESVIQADSPAALALARAEAKALAVDPGVSVVIGADQVAHLDGAAFGKPTDPADHRARLRQLRGRTHTLCTAVVLRDRERIERHLTECTVSIRGDLSDAEIDAYVATGEGSGCAGGYAAEGLGASLIASIEGDYTAVLGLPLHLVLGALRGYGWRPAFSRDTR
jgi:septum formation protein